MESKYPPKENCKVKIKTFLENTVTISGTVNISGFDRLSDFINYKDQDFISVYKINNLINIKEIILNKRNIAFISEV